MLIFKFSIVGPRGENQDTVYYSKIDNAGVLALVADGVGGSDGGRFASQCVKKAAEEAIKNRDITLETILMNAHRYVNDLKVSSAATTATLIKSNESHLYFAHTGDSRIYVLRGEGIMTLTEDQTEVALLIKEGVLTKETAQTYRRRNVLTHSIEKGAPLEIQTGWFDILPNDRVVLVTDGVHKALSKRRICDMSRENKNSMSLVKAIRKSVDEKIEDDASLVLIDFTRS